MNRRTAIVALLCAPMAQYTVAQAKTITPGKARLTLDLDSWSGVTVTFGGKTVHLTASDIFDALRKA